MCTLIEVSFQCLDDGAKPLVYRIFILVEPKASGNHQIVNMTSNSDATNAELSPGAAALVLLHDVKEFDCRTGIVLRSL